MHTNIHYKPKQHHDGVSDDTQITYKNRILTPVTYFYTLSHAHVPLDVNTTIRKIMLFCGQI